MQYFRIDYTDHEWYKLMKSFGENLPTEYCDCFDRHGEVAEDYEGIFCCDIYKSKIQERGN
jgi:hypothetical protein|tara:strand:+ start:1990 stop:2172 length:183 start_codon:yes stop_codon:yes gene_type:complete